MSVRFLFKIKTILGPLVFRLHNIIKNITLTSITFTQYAQNIICSNNGVCYQPSFVNTPVVRTLSDSCKRTRTEGPLFLAGFLERMARPTTAILDLAGLFSYPSTFVLSSRELRSFKWKYFESILLREETQRLIKG